MRISDWSSDVCSSDLLLELQRGRGPVDTGVRQAQQSPPPAQPPRQQQPPQQLPPQQPVGQPPEQQPPRPEVQAIPEPGGVLTPKGTPVVEPSIQHSHSQVRSEEPTSELQSLLRSSYAVFCLNKKTTN